MPCGCRKKMNSNATPSVARYQSDNREQKTVPKKPVSIVSVSSVIDKLYQDIENLKRLHKK